MERCERGAQSVPGASPGAPSRRVQHAGRRAPRLPPRQRGRLEPVPTLLVLLLVNARGGVGRSYDCVITGKDLSVAQERRGRGTENPLVLCFARRTQSKPPTSLSRMLLCTGRLYKPEKWRWRVFVGELENEREG